MIVLVIEGPDGVGKSTLAQRVVSDLRAQHVNAEYMHFPNYDYKTGSAIQDFLFGKFGDFRDVPTEVQTWLYAIDRYCWQNSLSKENDKKVYICDRYYTSSMIYQCANLYWRYKYLRMKERWDESVEFGYENFRDADKVSAMFYNRDIGIGSLMYDAKFTTGSGSFQSIFEYMKFAMKRETIGMGVHEADLIIGLDGPDEMIMKRKEQSVQETGSKKDNFEEEEEYVKVVNDMARTVMREHKWPIFRIDDADCLNAASKYVMANLPITPLYIIP